MKALLVGRAAWLVSLLFLAASFGAYAPVDIVGVWTPLVIIVGVLATACAAYLLESRARWLSFLMALVNAYLLAGFATVLALRIFGGSAQAVSFFCAGGLFAFLFTAYWHVSRGEGHFGSRRTSIAAFCFGTAFLEVPLMLMSYPGFYALAVLALSVVCMQHLSTAFALTVRKRRSTDVSYPAALSLVTKLYTAPIDAYRECLRKYAG